MATGHILPGYGQPVSKLRRAYSAGYPLEKVKLKEWVAERNPPASDYELDRIKFVARSMWSAQDREPTTYQFHHSEKCIDEPTRSRPTSSTRKHNPHPPLVFLTNRLHYIEGFQNPDATVGRGAYRVDGSVPHEEQARRLHMKSKFIGRPSTVAVDQYRERTNVRQFTENPVEAQAAEAWMKVADDKDVSSALHEVQKQKNIIKLHHQEHLLAQHYSDHQPVPSVHRFLKHAGKRELGDLYDQIRKKYKNYNLSTLPHTVITNKKPTVHLVADMREDDLEKTKTVRYQHKPSRGDYLIHPEWPPTFPYHKVP